jgi:hypothetical protein
MKKFLWFLVGMAIIISLPLLLFSGGTSLKKTPANGIETRKEQGPKARSAGDVKLPARGAGLPGKEDIDKKY